MFGMTIAEYIGETIENFFTHGHRYLIRVIRKSGGQYIIREMFTGREYYYIDDGRVLSHWKIDKKYFK